MKRFLLIACSIFACCALFLVVAYLTTFNMVVLSLFSFMLGGIYLGVVIPFLKHKPHLQKRKDLLIDPSALTDGRIVELASSGLIDSRLVLPRFVLKELYDHEVIHKLKALPHLQLRIIDTDFKDVKETSQKILRLARHLHADVLVIENAPLQAQAVEGVRIINIQALSNALKPLMQRGEYLNIKIQRSGKEDRQGVGYLEDGTMIVVNGGGDFIGKAIKACVLSVKHTSTGRLIFCNVADESI